MKELNALLQNMKDKECHWELLGKLAFNFARVAEEIDQIHHCLNMDDVTYSRSRLPGILVESHIYIECVKRALSIMPEEYSEVMYATVEEMNKEYTEFEDMEF